MEDEAECGDVIEKAGVETAAVPGLPDGEEDDVEEGSDHVDPSPDGRPPDHVYQHARPLRVARGTKVSCASNA